MATLFDDEQLELVYHPVVDEQSGLPAMRDLVLHHLRSVPQATRLPAARGAAFALVDLVLTLGGDNLPIGDLDVIGSTEAPSETLLVLLLNTLPAKLQRVGARSAIGAMLNVERVAGGEPSKGAYASITRTAWSNKRIVRNRPPLTEQTR
jgi:hypothetical protein